MKLMPNCPVFDLNGNDTEQRLHGLRATINWILDNDPTPEDYCEMAVDCRLLFGKMHGDKDQRVPFEIFMYHILDVLCYLRPAIHYDETANYTPIYSAIYL